MSSNFDDIVSGCTGCEGRRQVLINHSHPSLHNAIYSFDGYDFMWNVIAGVGTVVALYFLLRAKTSINI